MAFPELHKEIKVLGVGTAKDRALWISVWAVARQLDIPIHIVRVSGIEEILSSGIGEIPALVIDDRIVCEGRLPSVAEIIDILQPA